MATDGCVTPHAQMNFFWPYGVPSFSLYFLYPIGEYKGRQTDRGVFLSVLSGEPLSAQRGKGGQNGSKRGNPGLE